VSDTLTTTDLAKAFGVSPRSIAKWSDRGHLPCVRLPTQQAERRFTVADVVAFALANGRQDVAEAIGPRTAILAVGMPVHDAEALASKLGQPVEVAPNLFLAGLQLARNSYRTVIVDEAIGRLDVEAIGRAMLPILDRPRLALLASGDARVSPMGYDRIITPPLRDCDVEWLGGKTS
jgi:hypothetical protein